MIAAGQAWFDLVDLVEVLEERVIALEKQRDALTAHVADLEDRAHIDHAAAETRAAQLEAALGDLEERLRALEPQPALERVAVRR